MAAIRRFFAAIYHRLVSVVDRRPLTSFFILLAALFGLIVLSNLAQRPKPKEKEASVPAKAVSTYSIGKAPSVKMQAQVEKSGVIQIVALTSGVINQVNVTEGQNVSQGTNLIWMTTNYQGGNIFSLQRQLAGTQYQNVLDTYQTQKDIIAKQRDIAYKTNDNTGKLRDISAKSIDETKSLISLNQDIIDTLDANIKDLESSKTGGTGDAQIDQAILGAKQMKSQFQSGLNQLNSAVRNTEYQTNTDNPPTQLADLQRDITIKQLELQEKALDLSREVSRLQLQIAQVSEAMMHPVAPFPGVVQRVHVKVGQQVNPGTLLVTLSGSEGHAKLVVYAPREIARKISMLEQSTIHVSGTTLYAQPYFVSDDAVQGSLYAIDYDLPDTYYGKVTDKSYIEVDLPLGYPDTGSTIPFVPIDSVYQDENQSYIFVLENGKAVSRQVELGHVYGSYVEVTNGLAAGDTVVTSRTVLNGDRVTADK